MQSQGAICLREKRVEPTVCQKAGGLFENFQAEAGQGRWRQNWK
jgi:hypothetical protein